MANFKKFNESLSAGCMAFILIVYIRLLHIIKHVHVELQSCTFSTAFIGLYNKFFNSRKIMLRFLGPVCMRGKTGRLPGRDDARDPDMCCMFLYFLSHTV